MNLDDIKFMAKTTALGDESLVEIGRITVHFALLEWTLIDVTHRLLGLPERRARIITSELSFRGLQHLASSLVKERRPQLAKEFDAILKRVSACEEKRNVISHSMWGAGGVTSEGSHIVIRTKYTAKQAKGLRFMRQELTTADLYMIAREISITAFDLEVFGSSLGLKRKSD
jgi:hypothetical protein